MNVLTKIPPSSEWKFRGPIFINAATTPTIDLKLTVLPDLTTRKVYFGYMNSGAGSVLEGEILFQQSGQTKLSLPYRMNNVSGFEIMYGGNQHTPTGAESVPGVDLITIANGAPNRFTFGPIILHTVCNLISFQSTSFVGSGTLFFGCLSITPI